MLLRMEHAEALLVAWDVLQAAHDKGLLDILHGMIAAKDAITSEAGGVCEAAGGCGGDSQSAGGGEDSDGD